MRKTTWIAVAVAGLIVFVGGTAVAEEGADIFMAQKCNMCHSVASADIEATVTSEKMRGPDLGGYTADVEMDALLSFLTQESEKNGAKHKKKFAGTADEAKAILAWLKELDAAE